MVEATGPSEGGENLDINLKGVLVERMAPAPEATPTEKVAHASSPPPAPLSSGGEGLT